MMDGTSINPNIMWALAGVVGLLTLSTTIVYAIRKLRPAGDYTTLTQRIRSWWVMLVIFALAIVVHRKVSLAFFAVVSFLALKEYLSLIPTRRVDRRVLLWAYLAIPVQYFWIGIGWYGMFIIFIPVYMFLFLPARMLLSGATTGFLKAAGTLHWGLMTTVFSLSHAAYLLMLPGASAASPAGGAGLLLFLVFLTQFNDVSQFVWGKSVGRRKVMPKISPNKTWGGLIGGIGTTVLTAWLIAPSLTPLTQVESLLAGLIIGVAGFIGDVTISALKRDLGVKDSGTTIPGHGGILDRVDSLTYTAPLFFHFLRALYH